MKHSVSGAAVISVTFLLANVCGLVRAGELLTQHNDKQRTGANLEEPGLGVVGARRELWQVMDVVCRRPGRCAAALISRLAIDTAGNPDAPPTSGVFNTLIVATMHNTVYAYDADHERRGPDGRTVPLWARWLGKPSPAGRRSASSAPTILNGGSLAHR